MRNCIVRGFQFGVRKVVQGTKLGKMIYSFSRHRIKRKNGMMPNEKILNKLSKYSSDGGGSAIRSQKRQSSVMYNLAIIIPAYNVEEYIEECMRSVLSQITQFSYQVIIVNDGSSDSTPELLMGYEKMDDVTVLHQDNKGLSNARNVGLDIANAEYVFFLDSDDLLAPNAIEILLEQAYENDADVVEGTYTTMESKGKTIEQAFHKTGRLDNLIDLYGYPWGKVFRVSLFEMIDFPAGYWFEDSVCRHLIYEMADSIYGVSENVYFYRKNKNGISSVSRKKMKALDTFWITKRLFNERKLLGIPITEEYYYYILGMVRLSYSRIALMEKEVRETLFEAFVWFVNSNFSMYLLRDNISDFEYAIKTNNFSLFSLWVELRDGIE